MPETIKKCSIHQHNPHQTRLNNKLKERLGYLGIYSQRDPQQFFNNLTILAQENLLQEFKAMYSQILRNYFIEENQINNQIDQFVEQAFFVNLPLGKVVEIHLEVIDSLARQLELEGLHTEYLSDYRLTLIDVIAHLGEMYRSVLAENCLVSESTSIALGK
jgi:circadian clock protein KaiA